MKLSDSEPPAVWRKHAISAGSAVFFPEIGETYVCNMVIRLPRKGLVTYYFQSKKKKFHYTISLEEARTWTPRGEAETKERRPKNGRSRLQQK